MIKPNLVPVTALSRGGRPRRVINEKSVRPRGRPHILHRREAFHAMCKLDYLEAMYGQSDSRFKAVVTRAARRCKVTERTLIAAYLQFKARFKGGYSLSSTMKSDELRFVWERAIEHGFDTALKYVDLTLRTQLQQQPNLSPRSFARIASQMNRDSVWDSLRNPPVDSPPEVFAFICLYNMAYRGLQIEGSSVAATSDLTRDIEALAREYMNIRKKLSQPM